MQTLPRMLSIGLALGLAACSDSAPPPTETASPSPTPAPAPSPPSCELVMGWDPWEPYQYEIAGGQVFGLDVDLVTAVAADAGCDISFRKDSWRELLQQLEAEEGEDGGLDELDELVHLDKQLRRHLQPRERLNQRRRVRVPSKER